MTDDEAQSAVIAYALTHPCTPEIVAALRDTVQNARRCALKGDKSLIYTAQFKYGCSGILLEDALEYIWSLWKDRNT